MRILLLLLNIIPLVVFSQSEFILVGDISVEGNKRTKEEIILRELCFSKGDTISLDKLAEQVKQSEYFVMNTSLFSEVQIVPIRNTGSSPVMNFEIQVEENWYWYPFPIFELADRNFNVWWKEHNRSFKRVNIGLEFTHLNITGRRDKLRLSMEDGYTRKYSTSYSLPFINKSQSVGILGDVSFAQSREVNYVTIDNKQLFHQTDERFIYTKFKALVGISYRPGLRTYHDFIVRYHQNRIAEEISQELNPDFFLGGRSLQRYFSFGYEFTYDNRDIRPYPLKGNRIRFTLEKSGFGIFNDRSALTVTAAYDRHYFISQRWGFSIHTKGKASIIRTRQPYNDNRAIGFGSDFIRGYELYIIDGQDMAYFKGSARLLLIKNRVNFGKLMPIKPFKKMPFKVYLTANSDYGIVNDVFQQDYNTMTNRFLYGGGLGLDFVLYYDKVIRLEYNVNHLLERGLFLNVSLSI